MSAVGCCQFLKGDRNVVSVGCHFLDTDNRNVANIGHDVTDRVVPLDYIHFPNHGTSAGLSMGFKVGHIFKVYSAFRTHLSKHFLNLMWLVSDWFDGNLLLQGGMAEQTTGYLVGSLGGSGESLRIIVRNI